MTDHFLIVELGRYQRTIATNLPEGEVPVRFEEAGYGMIVADGLGKAGATASRLAITTLANLVLQFGKWQLRIDPDTADDVIDRAKRFYSQVDQTVTETGSEQTDLSGMGATLTAAYSAGDTLFLAHVGHSRAYLFRGGVLTQLTSRPDAAAAHRRFGARAVRGGSERVGPRAHRRHRRTRQARPYTGWPVRAARGGLRPAVHQRFERRRRRHQRRGGPRNAGAARRAVRGAGGSGARARHERQRHCRARQIRPAGVELRRVAVRDVASLLMPRSTRAGAAQSQRQPARDALTTNQTRIVGGDSCGRDRQIEPRLLKAHRFSR